MLAGRQVTLAATLLMLACCQRTSPVRASTRDAPSASDATAVPVAAPIDPEGAAPAGIRDSEDSGHEAGAQHPAAKAIGPEAAGLGVPDPPQTPRHVAQPIVPPESEAFATLIAKDPGPAALARLRRYLVGERLYCEFLVVQESESEPSLDEITTALPALHTLPEIATRAEQLVTRASRLACKEKDPASLGSAARRLLAQTAGSLQLLEQSLSPSLQALRGPILRRLDARILTARKVEEASFAPITRQLLIQRERIQRMGDLLDSQCATIELQRRSLARIVGTPRLFQPETLSEATTLARAIATQLHKTLSNPQAPSNRPARRR